jgi:GDP-4-dehydro-6-deoxy-D-mannose reductase
VRAYVTGGSGFVGQWLRSHLDEVGDEFAQPEDEVDVTDPEAITQSLVTGAPEVVYHLAALAQVGRSWEQPARTFEVNALGTLNVLRAATACERPPLVLLVSSAEVYGLSAGRSPITEDVALRPANPYAASKVAAEYLGLQWWLGAGLRVVRVRPFNHFGPGQSSSFVVSALAKRVAEAERTGGGTVRVGNLQASRDFTDVRDVVRAYRLLASMGEPGEAYNLASGSSIAISEVAERLCAMASRPVELVPDADLYRPVDIPVFIGAATRLRDVTGWEPRIPFDETLAAVLESWRSTVAAASLG